MAKPKAKLPDKIRGPGHEHGLAGRERARDYHGGNGIGCVVEPVDKVNMSAMTTTMTTSVNVLTIRRPFLLLFNGKMRCGHFGFVR